METIVKTQQGWIEGVKSEDGRTLIFKGVPYAQPPVGELRFRRAQAHEPWEGVRPCKEFAARCPQTDLTKMDFYGKEFYDTMVPECSEDCLYLNIWTPADAQPGDKLPVLFWIHGGALMHGFGSEKEFDGEGMAKKDVILVSINYRLNAFGFFAHPDLEKENDEHVSGNYGILDQLFAIHWVRDNIAAFGGDPDRITVDGQSAGCLSVQTLVSSPLTKGLISGAIMQSGGGLGSGMMMPGKEEVYATSRKFMEILKVDTIAGLRALPTEALLETAYAVYTDSVVWLPYVDGWLLPDTRDAQAEKGEVLDIHYMIGSCGDDAHGDPVLLNCTLRWGENQLRLGREPAYVYLFDRKLPGDDRGSFHSSELWYTFETWKRCWRPWEAHDGELAAEMSAYWANFVKNGNPNGDGLPQWLPYTKEHPQYITIQ